MVYKTHFRHKHHAILLKLLIISTNHLSSFPPFMCCHIQLAYITHLISSQWRLVWSSAIPLTTISYPVIILTHTRKRIVELEKVVYIILWSFISNHMKMFITHPIFNICIFTTYIACPWILSNSSN